MNGVKIMDKSMAIDSFFLSLSLGVTTHCGFVFTAL
jgi:hypothetical protein